MGMPALLVAQSGGPTAAINASLAGVVQQARQSGAVGGVLGARFGLDGILARDLVDLAPVDDARWERIRTTPSAALGSCRRKLREGEAESVLRILDELGVGYLVYIGGNDSADTAWTLHTTARATGHPLRVMAVPKTIDNDLPETDHCPGYGSAARYLAQSSMEAGLDTEAMRKTDPIKVIEVMGRDAGWLAAASILGRRDEREAPHLVCVPERPVKLDDFVAAMETAYRRYGYAVAVVTETVRDEHDQAIGRRNEVLGADAFGHATLAGAAQALSTAVGSALGLKARFDKPGTLQRMSMAYASPVDLDEAYAAGVEAARLAIAGESGTMIGFARREGPEYGCDLVQVDLRLIANRQRLLPEQMLGTAPFEIDRRFLDYAMPLIGAPLPEYPRL